MTAPSDRLMIMDTARGFAVMGILAMNIIAFAMPEAAYFNPRAWGGTSFADLAAWAFGFILVDGKMRALFSMLFGASMLLAMDKAEMAGRDGRSAHIARAFWLAIIGLAHYLLLWWGDILMLYAFVSMFALGFTGKSPLALVKIAFLVFGIHFLVVSVFAIALHWSPLDPATLASIGEPGTRAIAQELALYRGDIGAMVAERAAALPGWALSGAQFMALDTLGFMLLGMAMLKGGFLTGKWTVEQYCGTARHCFLIGLPPMIALATWAIWSGFDTVTTFNIVFAWSFPFRVPLSVGIAALIYWLVLSATPGPWLGRVAAAGRMTLSNYLGTSMLMTVLFYGWGFGLFGFIPRAGVYLILPAVWLLMLAWSQPWLSRFRYGPMEWVWRSLEQGKALKMKV